MCAHEAARHAAVSLSDACRGACSSCVSIGSKKKSVCVESVGGLHVVALDETRRPDADRLDAAAESLFQACIVGRRIERASPPMP